MYRYNSSRADTRKLPSRGAGCGCDGYCGFGVVACLLSLCLHHGGKWRVGLPRFCSSVDSNLHLIEQVFSPSHCIVCPKKVLQPGRQPKLCVCCGRVCFAMKCNGVLLRVDCAYYVGITTSDNSTPHRVCRVCAIF